MGWKVAVLVNTTLLYQEDVDKIEKLRPRLRENYVPSVSLDRFKYQEIDRGTYRLDFDPDDMEHIDYIPELPGGAYAAIRSGRLVFASLEGDNAGTWWGYDFHGPNGMEQISGSLTEAVDLNIVHLKSYPAKALGEEIKRIACKSTLEMPNCSNETAIKMRDLLVECHRALRELGAFDD